MREREHGLGQMQVSPLRPCGPPVEMTEFLAGAAKERMGVEQERISLG